MSTKYPEHEKLKKIQPQSEICGAFLDWLKHERSMFLARYRNDRAHEVYTSTTELLAQFFRINEQKLEKEKRQMLEEIRAQREVPR